MACGGTAPRSTQPAPAPTPPTAAPPPAGPGERECNELITHAVALGIDDEAAHGSPRTTEADHEVVRRELHEELVNGCRGLPRDAYRCAMAATSLDALAGCQRTPSSSTSNSSVAPPGITPPAPRSP